MENRLFRRGIFSAEENEYPEPDPGYTPVYPWIGAPSPPNHLHYDRPSPRSGLDHALGEKNEALGGLENSILDHHAFESMQSVADNVNVNPDFDFVDDNSM